MVDRSKIKKALIVEPYTNLYGLANRAQKRSEPTPAPTTTDVSAVDQHTEKPTSLIISPNANPLAHDIVAIIDSVYKKRGERLGISMGRLASAKKELLAKELAVEVWLGQSLFLAPTVKLYDHFELIPPYKRNVSTEHSFLILVAQKLIEANPATQKTAVEVPIGQSGRTIDLVGYMKEDQRTAFEITLSSSNVTENAAKLIGKRFSRIVFICRDDQLRRSVSTILKDADFEPDFAATIETEIFSALIRKKKKFNP